MNQTLLLFGYFFFCVSYVRQLGNSRWYLPGGQLTTTTTT